MKTSAVIASLLFGSVAVAAPFDRRALVYKYETVVETVIVYTTVYGDVPTSTPEAPAPAYSAPAQSNSYASGMSAGSLFNDVDITVYDNTGAAGACGEALYDDDVVVAIAQGAWNEMGGSTYNSQTGAATNPWCGKKVKVNYNGGSVVATIMDLCPGCKGTYDVDLSRGAWKALGIEETTRLKASWTLL
ncbi:DPBB-1 domain-containing protein [Pyrenophora tritici-repentis]|nr:DPBB-1 domain-containing protein [Pyrenophora tritici-repentis]KAI0608525.1 DPBB-1 domain-containing protein [Pyrenophora tritici-repentis]KAI0625025.1 DPBB-1 domain-containing protein [Pyrenophora tritici-repentis]PZD27974.1 hypothetical protein A1F96_06292 [Pyrenophora tritici-repentis]